jgi:hypothetical protein
MFTLSTSYHGAFASHKGYCVKQQKQEDSLCSFEEEVLYRDYNLSLMNFNSAVLCAIKK